VLLGEANGHARNNEGETALLNPILELTDLKVANHNRLSAMPKIFCLYEDVEMEVRQCDERYSDMTLETGDDECEYGRFLWGGPHTMEITTKIGLKVSWIRF